jgi:hypothetical protein
VRSRPVEVAPVEVGDHVHQGQPGDLLPIRAGRSS